MAPHPLRPSMAQYMNYLHQQMLQTPEGPIRISQRPNQSEVAPAPSPEFRWSMFLEVSLSRQPGRWKCEW